MKRREAIADRSFMDFIEKIINLIINHLCEIQYETIRSNNITISKRFRESKILRRFNGQGRGNQEYPKTISYFQCLFCRIGAEVLQQALN